MGTALLWCSPVLQVYQLSVRFPFYLIIMVAAALPVAQVPLVDGTKTFPGQALPSHVPTTNGVKTNGIHKPHLNGNSKPETYVNGYHTDIPVPSQRVQEPANSCDVVFGPKDKEGVYKMLNQPLGQKRPLKVIYLGGGASGRSTSKFCQAHDSIAYCSRSRTAINFAYRARSHLPDIDLVCYEKNNGLTGTCEW